MSRYSHDSSNVPLQPYSNGPANYSSNNMGRNPYSYEGKSAYVSPKKKGVSPWIKFGIPIALVVVAAAVVGGVVGARKSHNASASVINGPNGNGNGGGGGGGDAQNALRVFPVSTNSYELPIYPSTTNTALYSTPTFSVNVKTAWPTDPFQPSNPDPLTVRTDRPRIIAPAYKWAALPNLIQQDPYLTEWNDTIIGNASFFASQPPVAHAIDGGLDQSGILDPCRQVKERMKAWGYAYRLTNNSAWAERAWQELLVVSGNDTNTPWGIAPDNWNSQHFLDLSEMTAAFAFAYDWFNDYWTADRRTAIMWSIINLGLQKGIEAYNGAPFGWWTNNIQGNWNCVCNGGMTLGALAILGDDPTGTAARILGLSIPNASKNCVFGAFPDGSWTETHNYWYFGTTGLAEMASALQTATGSPDAFGLLSANPNLAKTGQFHMAGFGLTSLFNYGDHGPNKYSTTANAMMYLGNYFNKPEYTLFQRDRQDSAEPTGLFWYQPNVQGAFWDNLALDNWFPNSTDAWFSMRTSWTDVNGLYVAMKSSQLVQHQTHGDLDVGDFVFDALGQRWAGEYGSGDYDSPGYFSSEAQESERWLYFRKRTEGQNTLLIGGTNQNVNCNPTTQFESTGEAQGSSTVYNVPSSSTAFFTTDMTSAYNQTASALRGVRFLNGRKQVLLQDDVNSSASIEWRIHTNATIAIDSSGTTATLSLGGQKMTVQILSPSGGTAKFQTRDPVRLSTDPPLPSGVSDQLNPGVTILTIPLSAGQYSLQVLFTPQYPNVDVSSFGTPASVPVSQWSLTSHK